MGTVPLTIPTGKKNMLNSLRTYLAAQLTSETVLFESYENAEAPHGIYFQDVGVPNLGGHAFDDYMGQRDGQAFYGKVAQTLVEFNLITDVDDNTTAVSDLYNMRDRLEYLFMYSGIMGDNDALILPRIALTDYDQTPAVDTGATIWAPMDKDSMWIENYVGQDQARVGLKRLRILVRIKWHLLRP